MSGCRQCGAELDEDRRTWATPICYACLPPPKPLPVVPTREQLEVQLSAAVQRAEAAEGLLTEMRSLRVPPSVDELLASDMAAAVARAERDAALSLVEHLTEALERINALASDVGVAGPTLREIRGIARAALEVK